jgi:hypothetical protein
MPLNPAGAPGCSGPCSCCRSRGRRSRGRRRDSAGRRAGRSPLRRAASGPAAAAGTGPRAARAPARPAAPRAPRRCASGWPPRGPPPPRAAPAAPHHSLDPAAAAPWCTHCNPSGPELAGGWQAGRGDGRVSRALSSAAMTEAPPPPSAQARKARSSAQARASSSPLPARARSSTTPAGLLPAGAPASAAGGPPAPGPTRGVRGVARYHWRSSARACAGATAGSVVMMCFMTSSSASLQARRQPPSAQRSTGQAASVREAAPREDWNRRRRCAGVHLGMQGTLPHNSRVPCASCMRTARHSSRGVQALARRTPRGKARAKAGAGPAPAAQARGEEGPRLRPGHYAVQDALCHHAHGCVVQLGKRHCHLARARTVSRPSVTRRRPRAAAEHASGGASSGAPCRWSPGGRSAPGDTPAAAQPRARGWRPRRRRRPRRAARR